VSVYVHLPLCQRHCGSYESGSMASTDQPGTPVVTAAGPGSTAAACGFGPAWPHGSTALATPPMASKRLDETHHPQLSIFLGCGPHPGTRQFFARRKQPSLVVDWSSATGGSTA